MSDTAEPLYTDIGASRYQDAFVIPPQIRSLQTLLKMLPPKSRILDAGCGSGRPVGETLTAAGYDFTGVDVTPDMVELARKQLPGSIIHLADARTWEPAKEDLPFDCVVSYYAFLISVSNADTKALFPRVHKWLRPGGIFVFGTVAFEGEQEQVKWLGRDVTSSSLASDELKQEIRKAGFEIEDEERGTFAPERAVDVGLCKKEDVWMEDHLILFCRKGGQHAGPT